jgi:hypothetical protein
VYGFEVKILGLIQNTDVKIFSEKMVKKRYKKEENFCFLLLVCDLPFPPSLPDRFTQRDEVTFTQHFSLF